MGDKLLVLCAALLMFVGECVVRTHHPVVNEVIQEYDDMRYSLWQRVCINYNPRVSFFVITNVIGIFGFWIPSIVYLVLDYLPPKAWIHRFKVQSGTNLPPDREMMKKLVLTNLRNQIVQVLFSMPLYSILAARNPNFMSSELPTARRSIIEMVGIILCYEVFFFLTHWIAHFPSLYGSIHKIHHEWKSPIGMAAIYCHWIEHIVCNLLPLIMGPLILGCHAVTLWAWVTFGLISTVSHHSGYHFPWMLSSEYHDYHHLVFTQNFGVLGIMDFLFGTNSKFHESFQFQLHTTFLSDNYFEKKNELMAKFGKKDKSG